MNPRLTKELRPLLPPWALAAAGAIGHLAARPDSYYFQGAFGDFITGLAGLAFIMGVLVLAAGSMGTELHEHTLSLLLSQPMERARMWKEKLLATSVMVGSLAIIHSLATAAMGRLNLPLALLCAAFAVTAVCSVGYHTLATRSVLIGIACAVGLPYVLALCTFLIVFYVLGLEIELSERATLAVVLSACAAYSALSLWLSRRQFILLELKDAIVSRAAEVPSALVPRKLSDLFRPRPTGVVLNLIRKEVCLHKPIFLVSAIFTAAWLLTLLVLLLRPAWHDNCVATFIGLTGTQAVLMVILGGCTALGDDKALGTSTWHLTLPVSARRQWFIKLATALVTTFTVAVTLPTLLALLSLFKAKTGYLTADPNNLATAAIPCFAVFILSFWSASMTTNTVRAALMCVFALFGISAMTVAGVSLSETLFRASPIQSHLVAWLLAQLQVSPGMFSQHAGTTAYPVVLVYLVCTFATLAQSFALFRRGQTPASVRIKYAIILAAITCFGSFWCADLNKALPTAQKRFESEVGEALVLLPFTKQSKVNDSWSVSSQELEKTGQLTSTTVRWLKDSKITITRTAISYSRWPVQPFLISVTFPNRQIYAFGYAHYLPRY